MQNAIQSPKQSAIHPCMKKILARLCPLILIALLPACSSLEKMVSTPQASKLNTLTEFPALTTDETEALLLKQLDVQRVHYNKVVTMINEYLSQMDGQQRKFSLLLIGGRSVSGATSIASAALNAAAPAANLPWVQGATAANAAFTSVEKELSTQRLSGMAIRESLGLTANDIVEALKKLQFFEAYAAALRRDETAFATAYIANLKALMELESAITLKPLTHMVKVESIKETTPEAADAE